MMLGVGESVTWTIDLSEGRKLLVAERIMKEFAEVDEVPSDPNELLERSRVEQSYEPGLLNIFKQRILIGVVGRTLGFFTWESLLLKVPFLERILLRGHLEPESITVQDGLSNSYTKETGTWINPTFV